MRGYGADAEDVAGQGRGGVHHREEQPMTAAPSPRRPPRATPLGVVRRSAAAWRRLSPFFGASRGMLALTAAGSVVAGLVEAALLVLIASVAQALSAGATAVDTMLGPVPVRASLTTLINVGIGLALLRTAVQLGLAYLPARLSATVNATLRRRLFTAFTGTSWPVQAAERDGHFQSLMNVHVSNASSAVLTLSALITSSLMFLTLLGSAFALSVPTALVVIAVSALLFIALLPLSRRLRRHAKALSAENLEYSQGIQEVVLMAEETQVFGSSPAYRANMDALIERVRVPLQRTRFLGRAVPNMYQSAAFTLLVLALGALVWTGATTGVAELGAVVLLLIRSLTFGQGIQQSLTRLDELIPFMHRLRDAMDHYAANPRQDGEEPLGRVERLGMRDVHYSYAAGVEVLKDITFEVRRGEALGIVGPSGAGKSSLVQLLLRLRVPDRGSLAVNGQDARTVRRDDWQARVAYVPQTAQLVHGTVADNIRFYRTGLSDEAVEAAARRAHIHDDIVSWPQGYRTVVGQRASAVSGGQRQRLCLARALVGDPDVLILDEPTSALDVKSEALVQESLQELKREVVLFLVAHRLSTLSVCDRVMVVVDGRVQAIDAPAALVRTNAFYREVTEITRQQSVMAP